MDVKKGSGGNGVEGDGLVWEDPLERRLPPRRPHSTFQIAGVPVLWPKPLVPFAPQLAVMSRMIAAIQKRYNALLESPTGTGKTLAILGGVLSWQRAEFLARVKDTFKADELSKAAATPVPTPSTSPARTPALDDSATSGSDMDSIPVKNAKELPRPRKIFFSSRTHSQLKQAIKELRRCDFFHTFLSKETLQDTDIPRDTQALLLKKYAELRTSLLASRNHYCINRKLEHVKDKNEACQQMLEDHACGFYRQAGSLKDYLPVVFDIEEAVTAGRRGFACPYFGTREMAEDAQIVFCPYNYLLSPVIRERMDIDLSDAIVVVDEAHNVEDTCRDAASVKESEDMLHKLINVHRQSITIHRPFLDLMTKLRVWLGEVSKVLNPHSQRLKENVWEGEDLLDLLKSKLGMTAATMTFFQNLFQEVVKVKNDAQKKDPQLSGMVIGLLESFLTSLQFLFSKDNIKSYRLVVSIEDFRQKGPKNRNPTLHLWCMSAAVAFRTLCENTHSVILTSGTLHPLDAMEMELGVPFEVKLEASHVIEQSQLWAGVQAVGIDGTDLKGTHVNVNTHEYQDALGHSIYELCRAIPNGVLCLLPSYRTLDLFVSRWTATGLADKLKRVKHLFMEPRDPQVSLEELLQHYRLAARDPAAYNEQCAEEAQEGKEEGMEEEELAELASQVEEEVVESKKAAGIKSYFQQALSSKATVEGSQEGNGSQLQSSLDGHAELRRVTRLPSRHTGRQRQPPVMSETESSAGGDGLEVAQVASQQSTQAHSSTAESQLPTQPTQPTQVSSTQPSTQVPSTQRAAGGDLLSYLSQNTQPHATQTGALILAVSRGKISEGIDFADEAARAVLIVGVPFPSLVDQQVVLKREYQDQLKKEVPQSASTIDGGAWYKQQAFRAMNQGLGRCIRHKNDYGAIVLLDSRFRSPYYVSNLSKWLRSSVIPPQSPFVVCRELRQFYQRQAVEDQRRQAEQRRIEERYRLEEAAAAKAAKAAEEAAAEKAAAAKAASNAEYSEVEKLPGGSSCSSGGGGCGGSCGGISIEAKTAAAAAATASSGEEGQGVGTSEPEATRASAAFSGQSDLPTTAPRTAVAIVHCRACSAPLVQRNNRNPPPPTSLQAPVELQHLAGDTGSNAYQVFVTGHGSPWEILPACQPCMLPNDAFLPPMHAPLSVLEDYTREKHCPAPSAKDTPLTWWTPSICKPIQPLFCQQCLAAAQRSADATVVQSHTFVGLCTATDTGPGPRTFLLLSSRCRVQDTAAPAATAATPSSPQPSSPASQQVTRALSLAALGTSRRERERRRQKLFGALAIPGAAAEDNMNKRMKVEPQRTPKAAGTGDQPKLGNDSDSDFEA